MADKYLYLNNNGIPAIREAHSISQGGPSAGKIIAATTNGKIDVSFLPAGAVFSSIMATKMIVASEPLIAGNFVNIFQDNSTLRVRKASSSKSYPADGFVIVNAAVGEEIEVYFEGFNDKLSGLNIGIRYYMSELEDGAVTSSFPQLSGCIIQYVGKAVSTTELYFTNTDYYLL